MQTLLWVAARAVQAAAGKLTCLPPLCLFPPLPPLSPPPHRPPAHSGGALRRATAVLVGRYSNGKVWAISAKNSATGTEMFGGKIDEQAQTLKDPQWGTQYSLTTGDVVGKWCPSPPIIGGLIGAIFPQQGVWVPQVINRLP